MSPCTLLVHLSLVIMQARIWEFESSRSDHDMEVGSSKFVNLYATCRLIVWIPSLSFYFIACMKSVREMRHPFQIHTSNQYMV